VIVALIKKKGKNLVVISIVLATWLGDHLGFSNSVSLVTGAVWLHPLPLVTGAASASHLPLQETI